jgi:deoxyribonuclease IV
MLFSDQFEVAGEVFHGRAGAEVEVDATVRVPPRAIVEKLGRGSTDVGDGFDFLHAAPLDGLEAHFDCHERLEPPRVPVAGIDDIIVEVDVDPPQTAGLAAGRRPLDELRLELLPLPVEIPLSAGEPFSLPSRPQRPQGDRNRRTGEHGRDKRADHVQRTGHARHSRAGERVYRAVETGCECLQIFTRNINQWKVAPLDPAAAAAFRAAVKAARLDPVVAHDSYLINPASADPALRKQSIDGLVTELERADALGIRWVVAHPGAAGEQPVSRAVARAADGIAQALTRTKRLAAGILIETTAGQGTCLGATFEEIGTMLERIDAKPGLASRVGVCLDTCHVFAAGYPLAPKAALDETIRAFDRLIGLERLVVIHANDSKRECGSRVDRHEAIGKGKIGRDAFQLIVNHPKLKKIPMILETPKEGPDGKPTPTTDRHNLELLRKLAGQA